MATSKCLPQTPSSRFHGMMVSDQSKTSNIGYGTEMGILVEAGE
jgi:hypothetical protein